MDTMPAGNQLKSILLDIEGTTTSISFVYDVLFPYARRNIEPFLLSRFNDPDVRCDVEMLEQEHQADVANGLSPPALASSSSEARVVSIASYAKWLMDLDRKTTPLKSLQGMIWESGYHSGEIKGHLYEDVPRAFHRWADAGLGICIYSSGSALAQKLLFSNSEFGDLENLISGHFDTEVGPKREPESYQNIASRLDQHPSQILFVSDVIDELAAAQAAGLSVALAVRDKAQGHAPNSPPYQVIESFDELSLGR